MKLKAPLKILLKKMYYFLFSFRAIYFQKPKNKNAVKLNRILCMPLILPNEKFKICLKHVTYQYLNHRFDLLGSGWVHNKYDSLPLGLEGLKYNKNIDIRVFDQQGKWLVKILHKKHIKTSQKIWEMVESNYLPIDWQKDYKSGYRWSNKEWHKACLLVIGRKPGVDIKIPWELARMQHLPQMAIFARSLGGDEQQRITQEFCNQVLDFIATNPVGFGVNWSCTMDVAIRAANILLAFDLFKDFPIYVGVELEIEKLISESMFEHGKFIVENLEYSERFTGNHYLANICGLAFIAAYLEASHESDLWLAFSLQELIREFGKQFHDDGSNFEASTSYHRLSTEMVIFTTALFFGLSKSRMDRLKAINLGDWKQTPRLNNYRSQEYNIDSPYIFPKWYLDRLFKAGCFTADLLKPNNQIPQIGDNDSGRFFKFAPVGEFLTNKEAENKYMNLKGYIDLGYSPDEFYWDENILDHRPLLSAFSGLYNYEEFNAAKKENSIERQIIESYAKINSRIKKEKSYNPVKLSKKPNIELSYVKEMAFNSNNSSLNVPLNQNLTIHPYPDSGIYILKSDRVQLTIMAGSVGQNGLGGHAHNDKLSVDLIIDRKDLVVDPGTYLYTALIDRRNEFRSTEMHNCIYVFEEQNIFPKKANGLFQMKECSKSSVIIISNNKLIFLLKHKKYSATREIQILSDKIIITDYCERPFQQRFQIPYLSKGYGKLQYFLPS